MRTSSDEIRNGVVVNGYDYEKQCWVIDSIIQRCGHPESMQCRCYGRAHAGEKITQK